MDHADRVSPRRSGSSLPHGEYRDDCNAFEPVLTFALDGAATRLEVRTVFPTKELPSGSDSGLDLGRSGDDFPTRMRSEAHEHGHVLRREAMLIYSMGVSVDGFIADREGSFGWSAPDEELFRFHIALVGELGGVLCGRRLYETMLVWDTDPSLRDDELGAAFAEIWCAIPKVVFSRTLDRVQGNARLAQGSLEEEIAAALDATDKDVEIGGAGLAAQAIGLGLVDELRMFRNPVIVGGGTPFLPPVTADIALHLIESRTLGSRVIYERYGRARDGSE